MLRVKVFVLSEYFSARESCNLKYVWNVYDNLMAKYEYLKQSKASGINISDRYWLQEKGKFSLYIWNKENDFTELK